MESARFLRLLFFSPWKQQYQADIALGPAVINEASAGPEIARRCFRQDGFGSAPERRACALSRSPRRPCGRALACCLRKPLAGRCAAAGPLPAPGACGGPQEPACEGEWTPGRARPTSTPPRFSGNGSGATTSAPGVRSVGAVNSKELSPVPILLGSNHFFPAVHSALLLHPIIWLQWVELSPLSIPGMGFLQPLNSAEPPTQKMHFACRRLGWKYSSS